MTPPAFGAAEARAVAPLAAVSFFAIVGLLRGTFARDDAAAPGLELGISFSGLAAGLLAVALAWQPAGAAFGGTFALDGVAAFTDLVCTIAAGLTLLMARSHLRHVGVKAREFAPLVLFSLAGMVVVAGARDLIVLFLGVEMMSIPAYVLAGIQRREPRSGEAALKYFVLGAFAAAFLLYGIALLFGGTGATSYDGIAAGLGRAPSLVLLGATALLMVGLGFKIGIVPFHFWAPDVYQGAPTSVTAFLTVGIKAAAVAGAARLFVEALGAAHVDWGIVLWWGAALTMTLGNVVAIAQSNVKRMLAYSSVAHAGYLLAALAAGTREAGGALLFYLLAYAFMNLGAFAVVIAVGARGEPNEQIRDYAGLGLRRPALAAAMAICLLSLMGMPPLVGFAGKLYLVQAMVGVGYVGLAVLLMLNSVASAFYYLRVIVAMFMREPAGEEAPPEPRPLLALSIALAVVGTVLLGIFPHLALDFARAAFLPGG